MIQSVCYRVECQTCGGTLGCTGTQALIRGRLEWSIEVQCADCGQMWVECGRDGAPEALRTRLLAEHGPATLTVAEASAPAVPVMKVLRADQAITLAEARLALERLRRGEYTGTLPEMARLAGKLESSGVPAYAQVAVL